MAIFNQKTAYFLKILLLVNIGVGISGLLCVLYNPSSEHIQEGSVNQRSLLKATEYETLRYRQTRNNNDPAESTFAFNNNMQKQCDCSQCRKSKAFDREKSNINNLENHKPDKIGEDFDLSAEFQVPNIVHYIWYNTEPAPFHFHYMLSVMSASKNINPEVIYFHTDIEPIGEFWEKTKRIPNLKIVKRDPPVHIFGEDVKPPKFYTSHSNVDRVKVLMEYGGIYLDFDVFVTKSFNDLRKHVCTIGLESDEKACGSIIVCSKQAVFLILWMNSYFDDYRIEEWAYNTGQVPFNLAKRFPHLVHVEHMKLNRPSFTELNVIYGDKSWNWRDNYAVHTWYRLWKTWSNLYKGVEPNPENIKTLNNTFGQIARFILYNTSEIIT